MCTITEDSDLSVKIFYTTLFAIRDNVQYCLGSLNMQQSSNVFIICSDKLTE